MVGSEEGFGAGTPSGNGQVPPLPQSRASRTQMQSARRRKKQRRRLLAVAAVVVVGVAIVIFEVSGGGSGGGAKQASAPPRATTSTSTTTTVPPPYLPPAVAPLISPPLPGEGVRTAADSWSGATPSVMTTSFRPDPTQPSIVAYATWLRSSSTQLALYPGYEGPGPTTLDRGPELVPVAARGTLLATFNSGFYEKDSAAGFFVNGTLYFPMIDGLATVVTYTNGTVDIVDWQGGPTPGSNIVMARQNLTLLVNGSQATSATTGSRWGAFRRCGGRAWALTLMGTLCMWPHLLRPLQAWRRYSSTWAP
jgi:hypothetical protein